MSAQHYQQLVKEFTWYLSRYCCPNFRFGILQQFDKGRNKVTSHGLFINSFCNLEQFSFVRKVASIDFYLLETVCNHVPYPPTLVFEEAP